MRTLFSIFLLIPYSAFSQSVETKREKGVDFEPYKTFRVDKGELVTRSELPIDETTFYKNIKEAITLQLTEKGYQAVEDSTAQLTITYVGEGIVKMDTQDVGPLGQRPVSDPSQVDAGRQDWSREYRQGSIVIEVYDTMNKKRIWQSTGTVEITSMNDPRLINAVVFRSFKKFPKKK